MTEFYLQMQYGDAVQVEYVDLADPAAQAQFPDLVALIEDRDLPYPLVAVNDQMRLAGSAQYYQVVPLVEEILEAERAKVEA